MTSAAPSQASPREKDQPLQEKARIRWLLEEARRLLPASQSIPQDADGLSSLPQQ